MNNLGACKYQEEINELLRMKKQFLLPQGACVQTQERNQWKAHCLKIAIFALAQLSRTELEAEPLTLEQLRKMDGKPVYVVAKRFKGWEIVRVSTEDGGPYPVYFTNVHLDDMYYGKTWLAYTREPVEGGK